MAYTVAEPCVNCKYTDCVTVCPVECFYEADNVLYIHPDECIDCGACVPECPVQAIFPNEEVPEEWLEVVRDQRPGDDRRKRRQVAEDHREEGGTRSSKVATPLGSLQLPTVVSPEHL